MESRNLQMGTFTKANTKEENSMERENTFGQMDLVMRVLSSKGAGKDKEIGNQRNQVEIFTLEHMKETKKVAMDAMFGLMDALMKDTF